MNRYLSQLSERDQRTVRLGGLAAAVILAIWLIVFPAMDHWDSLSREYDERLAALRAVETALSEEASAVTALRELRERATIHPDRFALNEQTARMLQQVEQLPGYEQLVIFRLESLPLRDEDVFHRSAVSVQFEGTLRDLHTFLVSVEEARPSLKVERLALNRHTRDDELIEGHMVIAGYAVVASIGVEE